MKKYRTLTVLVILIAFISSCEKTGQNSPNDLSGHHAIQIKGSDTMVNLGQAWAEAFMLKNPEAFVAVTGGGSGTGIAALISGTCDVAESSRKMKQKEFDEANKNGVEPIELTVALDGLAVVVSQQNPVNGLTIGQVADIYTGKIKNWKDVGGDDLEIVLLSREVNSGTHVYFKEQVLRGGDAKRTEEFDEASLLMPSSQAIADEIAQNPNAIGYYGVGYSSSTQKILAIAKEKNSAYVLPTIENIMEGHYCISRPLLMYTNGAPKGIVKKFIDYILSEEGQDVVRQVDFVPLHK